MTKATTTSPLTRNQKKKISAVPSEMKLRKIVPEVPVATQDRIFPHYVPNSFIKHSKSDSKDCSQEIL
jgi:hypothetical protein